MDELSTRLAEAPGDTDALAAARGLPEDERAALVDALKARVDAAVRAAPADALPASEALALSASTSAARASSGSPRAAASASVSPGASASAPSASPLICSTSTRLRRTRAASTSSPAAS
ncbi:MAG: hypothetical protein AAGI22_20260, partial [Planctomycetota bacterium]